MSLARRATSSESCDRTIESSALVCTSSSRRRICPALTNPNDLEALRLIPSDLASVHCPGMKIDFDTGPGARQVEGIDPGTAIINVPVVV